MTYEVVNCIRGLDKKLRNALLPLGLYDQALRDIAALAAHPNAHPSVRKAQFSRKLKYGPWRLIYAVFRCPAWAKPLRCGSCLAGRPVVRAPRKNLQEFLPAIIAHPHPPR